MLFSWLKPFEGFLGIRFPKGILRIVVRFPSITWTFSDLGPVYFFISPYAPPIWSHLQPCEWALFLLTSGPLLMPVSLPGKSFLPIVHLWLLFTFWFRCHYSLGALPQPSTVSSAWTFHAPHHVVWYPPSHHPCPVALLCSLMCT